MTDIVLNGRRFVKGKSAVVESLFQPGGTASGYYNTRGGVIRLFKPNGELDGVINRYGVLAKATRRDDGKTWYSYGDLATVGRWTSYGRRIDEVKAAYRAVFGNEPEREPVAA